MTILYKPVLIETAEQAEALPEGTVLIREGHFAFQKYAGQFVSADPHDLPTGAAWEVVGWTALVPIEAEEETVLVYADEPDALWTAETFRYVREARAIADGRPNHLPPVKHRTRLVTPWEEA